MQIVETEQPRVTKEIADSATPRIVALLIEDNPGDARLIELMLAGAVAGLFQVEQVDRLDKGLDRLAQGGIDIVLADLSLPDSHGLNTFTRLHARAPQVPIIVLSGLNDTTVAVGAVHEGAQDFLVKGQVDGQLLARSIRYAIERKRMSEQLHQYARELREKNAQLEADFNMAREIQQIFLPNQYPSFPRWATPEESDLKFAHRYIPAAAVGGDFFDVFPVDDTRAGIFICDVMGHGMRAALITAIMRGLIEELMPVASDAGRFLTDINRSCAPFCARPASRFWRRRFMRSSISRMAKPGSPMQVIPVRSICDARKMWSSCSGITMRGTVRRWDCLSVPFIRPAALRCRRVI